MDSTKGMDMNTTTHTPTMLDVLAAWCGEKNIGKAEYDRRSAEYTKAAAHDELVAALQELVNRCDGDEGVRADGSNIQTMRAHAILEKLEAA